jgi:predicted NUDIX family phosphoesterase
MSKFEQVVAIRADSLKDKLLDGFMLIAGDEKEKQGLFNQFFKPEEIVIGSRHWMEQDENFLQIIPCCLFRKPDGTVLNYQRVKNTGESRLLGNYSVCVGGHMNLQELQYENNRVNIASSVWNGIFREVREELGVDLENVIYTDCVLNYENYFDEFRGIIYDSSNAVGRVHIGLLFVFDVNQDCEFDSKVAESEGLSLKGWHLPETLLYHHDIDAINLENWAKIVLEAL